MQLQYLALCQGRHIQISYFSCSENPSINPICSESLRSVIHFINSNCFWIFICSKSNIIVPFQWWQTNTNNCTIWKQACCPLQHRLYKHHASSFFSGHPKPGCMLYLSEVRCFNNAQLGGLTGVNPGHTGDITGVRWLGVPNGKEHLASYGTPEKLQEVAWE